MEQRQHPPATRQGEGSPGPESLSRAALVKFASGAGLIIIAWAMGEGLVRATGLPLPPAIMGMGLLFMAIFLFPALAATVQPAGSALLKRLPLFLYPVTAGFLTLPAIGFGDLAKLILVLSVSLILSMIVCVRIFQAMNRDDR